MFFHPVGVLLFIVLQLVNVKLINGQQFSCQGRPSGYYADMNTGCQVYHMCDGLGRQFSYTCPNATLFQQRMLICDHWYMVNCSKSEPDYRANLLIGQKNKPFVEDYEKQRTPRPDLLTNRNQPVYNLYSRNNRVLSHTNLNKLVGVDTERNEENDSQGTDKPLYFVPSHWSTEYSRESTTESSSIKLEPEPSAFTKFNTITSRPRVVIKKKIVPPQISNDVFDNFENRPLRKKQTARKRPKPNSVVNFPSNYENTTPKFPTFVDESSKKFDVEAPHFENKHNSSDPNIFLEPPRNSFQSTKNPTNYNSPSVKVKKQNVQEYPWHDLRNKFFIPDVLLPLDMAWRPSYDNSRSSFHVKTVPVYVTNDTETQ